LLLFSALQLKKLKIINKNLILYNIKIFL